MDILERAADGHFYGSREISIACYEGRHQPSSLKSLSRGAPITNGCDLPYCECHCHKDAVNRFSWFMGAMIFAGVLLLFHFLVNFGWVVSLLVSFFSGAYIAVLNEAANSYKRIGGKETADIIERRLSVRLPSKII